MPLDIPSSIGSGVSPDTIAATKATPTQGSSLDLGGLFAHFLSRLTNKPAMPKTSILDDAAPNRDRGGGKDRSRNPADVSPESGAMVAASALLPPFAMPPTSLQPVQ